MIVDCIADLHAHYPRLSGGDLLIVAGDVALRDTQKEIDQFDAWFAAQKYRKKIFIAGNHDGRLEKEKPRKYIEKSGNNTRERFEYLCDSGTEFEGLKIWGSPWSLWFHGIHPKCKAFTGSENDLAKKWALIPDDVDILITHSPPKGILDKCYDGHVGSEYLVQIVSCLKKPPRLWIWGHIHEAYGKDFQTLHPIMCVNASYVNEFYKAVNKPIRIEL